MERLWHLMLVKEKRVGRQQTVQFLAELQGKAVSLQEELAIRDAACVLGVLQALTSGVTGTVRVGERVRDGRVLPKTGPTALALLYAPLSTVLFVETLWASPQYSKPPVQGEGMEDADNQGAGEQGRPIRQNMEWGYSPPFRRGSPH